MGKKDAETFVEKVTVTRRNHRRCSLAAFCKVHEKPFEGIGAGKNPAQAKNAAKEDARAAALRVLRVRQNFLNVFNVPDAGRNHGHNIHLGSYFCFRIAAIVSPDHLSSIRRRLAA